MKTKNIFLTLISLFLVIFLFTNCDVAGTVSDIIEPLLTRDPDPVTVLETYKPQECEYLFIMYIDGDNDLHDALYVDLNEMEEALYQYSLKEGSKPSVKIVALWDGWKLSGTNYGGAATQILEIGAASDNDFAHLCSNTLDLTATAKDWINYDETKKTGEVNMGDKSTLTNFLKWVDEYYQADHKILQFSNHGGGPRSALDISQRRGLCWDFTSDEKNAFLKTKDVSDAFAAAGYGKDKDPFDMLIFDVCLGASIEDSYQFKDYAKYLLGSANTVPGNGLDYRTILKNISENATIPDIGKGIIDDFKEFYTVFLPELDPDGWGKRWENEIAYWQKNYIDPYYKENGKYPNFTATDLATFSLPDACTFSLIDLSQVQAVADAVNDLADFILDNAESLYSYGINNGTKVVPILVYLGDYFDHYFDLNKPVYQGTFTWLHDIGFMAENIATFCNNLGIPETDDSNTQIDEATLYLLMNTGLMTKANALKTALQSAITYTWREGPNANASLYHGENLPYGMTIAGARIAQTQDGTLIDYFAPDFYKTDLAFGNDTSWGDLLELYFGTDSTNIGILRQ